MCVVSMIHDHYEPRIEPWIRRVFPSPFVPFVPSDPRRGRKLPKQLDDDEIETLRKLIEDFSVARKAAETVDALTSQPNCVDPEKAKLQERVRELEEELRRLKRSRASAAK